MPRFHLRAGRPSSSWRSTLQVLLLGVLGATNPLTAQVTANAKMSPVIDLTQKGWNVTTQNGNLTMAVPVTTIPGEIPIPVVVGINGTYLANKYLSGSTSTTSYLQAYSLASPINIRTYTEIDRPVAAGVHFGYIAPSVNYGGAAYVQGLTVLENGYQVADADWSVFSSKPELGGVLNLPQAYGCVAVSTSAAKVDPTGTYLTYDTALSNLSGNLQSWIPGLLPQGFGSLGSTYRVVMDKNLARVFILAPGINTWVPLVWADRFGHRVTFQWNRVTSGLPSGITAQSSVTVQNQRGKGVVLRWAEFSSGAAIQDILRVDFTGISAPSLLMRGYPGVSQAAPSGYVDPFVCDSQVVVSPSIVGSYCRPTQIQVGQPGIIPQPSWSGTTVVSQQPSSLGQGYIRDAGSGEAPASGQTWSFSYDPNHAEIASCTDPLGVTSTFTYTNYGATRGVSQVNQADGLGYQRTKRWTRNFGVSPMTVKVEGWWDPVQQSTPNRYHLLTLWSDSLNYGNGVYQTDALMDSAGKTWSTTTYSYSTNGAGFSAGLSGVTGVSISRDSEPTLFTYLGYASGTSSMLQVVTTNVVASGSDGKNYQVVSASNTYGPRWDMLEGQQLRQMVSTRYSQDGVTALPSVTTINQWDTPNSGPSLLQLQQTYLSGGGAGSHGSSFTYDSDGRLSSQSVYHVEGISSLATPNITALSYDSASGSLTSSVITDKVTSGSPSLSQSQGTFDTWGRATTQTDATGVTTTVAYDDRGRLMSKARPGSPTITYSYPSATTVQVTANGLTTTYSYDGYGRLRTVLMPTGVGSSGQIVYTTQTLSYDAYGRRSSIREINPAGASRTQSWSYDALDRMTSQTPIVGNAQTFTYVTSGPTWGVTTTLANNTSSTVWKDLFGQVVRTQAPDGTVSQATFDGMGNRTSLTVTPSGGTPQNRTWMFDGLGRLLSKTEPETSTQVYSTFNAMNQPTSITEAYGTTDARSRTLTFDGFGRMIRMVSGGDSITQSYTGPNLTSATRTTAGQTTSQTFTYQGPGGRLNAESLTLPDATLNTAYAYDSLGRLQTLTYPAGRQVGYAYDALSRVTAITNNSQSLVNSIKFDDWGNRSQLTFASGATDSWAADPTGARLMTWNIGYVGGGTDSRTYQYDDATQMMKQAGEWTLTHDSMGRLLEADGFGIATTHQYDGYGNQTYTLASQKTASVPQTFNNFTFNPMVNNQLPGLEKNGALTGWTSNLRGEATQMGTATSSNQALGLTWDGLGAVKSVGWSTGNQTYLYSPAGLRVAVTDTYSSANNRRYAYTVGGGLLSEYTASGTPAWKRDVIYLGGKALAEIDSSGVHELHTDHLGSPRVSTRGSGTWGSSGVGTMEGAQAFGPYGEKISASGYIPLTGYTGHLQTDPSGLIYMRGRYYSPAWHRFVNSDQGVDPSSRNQFAYVGGRPFASIDPSGLVIQIPEDDAFFYRNFYSMLSATASAGGIRGSSGYSDSQGTGSSDSDWLADALGSAWNGFLGLFGGNSQSQTNQSGYDIVSSGTPVGYSVSGNNVNVTGLDYQVVYTSGSSQTRDWKPDFINVALNIAIPTPWTGTLLGITVNTSYSRDGKVYVGAGPTIGKSATAVSGSVTPQWMIGGTPTADSRNSFLSGWNISGSTGYWGGAVGSWTSGSGFAAGAGFVSPQVGVSATYTPSWGVFNTGKGW